MRQEEARTAIDDDDSYGKSEECACLVSLGLPPLPGHPSYPGSRKPAAKTRYRDQNSISEANAAMPAPGTAATHPGVNHLFSRNDPRHWNLTNNRLDMLAPNSAFRDSEYRSPFLGRGNTSGAFRNVF